MKMRGRGAKEEEGKEKEEMVRNRRRGSGIDGGEGEE